MNEFSKCFIFVCLEKVIITIKFYLCHSCNTMEIQFLQIVWWKEYNYRIYTILHHFRLCMTDAKLRKKVGQKNNFTLFFVFHVIIVVFTRKISKY